MTDLYRHRTTLSGFPGAPGVCTMYFLDAVTTIASLRAFWDGIKGMLPIDLSAQVEASGDIINAETGALTGAWSGTGVAAVVGTSAAVYAAPVGLVVDWLTSTILDSHHLRGRSFIVPVTSGFFEVNGSPTAEAISALGGAAAGLIAAEAGIMQIWHRPRAAVAADLAHLEVTARVGGHGDVTASHVPDLAAVLRSRRD